MVNMTNMDIGGLAPTGERVVLDTSSWSNVAVYISAKSFSLHPYLLPLLGLAAVVATKAWFSSQQGHVQCIRAQQYHARHVQQ